MVPLQKHSRKGSAASIFFLIILVVLIIFVVYYFILPYFQVAPELQISPNWAGYMVVSDLNNPSPSVTSVNGSWTVPSVTGTRDSYSVVWIGIGGQFDNTLIQTGTEQDWLNNMAVYSVWYDALPAGLVRIDSINVSPGDVIYASISLQDSTTNTWSIELRDVTTGQSFQKSLVYDSSRLSAEWIIERPLLSNNEITTIPNYGTVQFNGCIAKIGSASAGIGSFSRLQYNMYDLNNTLAISNVSPLSSNGESFAVSYIGTG